MSPGVKHQICFSKRYKKLDPLKLQFTTVRWLDSFYRLGTVYEIFYVVPNAYHRKIHLGSAKLIKMEIKMICELSAEFTQADADCGTNDFYQLMRSWYEKKPEWNGSTSQIQVLTLMRCFQINEFDIQEGIKKTLVKQEPLKVFT